MKLKIFSLLIIILTSLFSCSQEPKYEIIVRDIKLYEFNNQRDKIYITTENKDLLVYDINTQELTKILTSEYFCREILYDIKSDMLYYNTAWFMYRIKNDEIIEKISPVKDDKDIPNFDIQSIDVLLPYYNILNLKNGSSVFTYEEYIETFLSNEQNSKIDIYYLTRIKDSTFQKGYLKKKRTINYFENNKIIIDEQVYHCNYFAVFFSIWSPPLPCRYKMKLTSGKFKLKLKDKGSRNAYMMKKGIWWSGRIEWDIPESKYITGVNGDIYLPFYVGDDKCLIKISME